MMHNNKLVVCVKTNGKVLREDKDTVFLPFGSEYSLLLKNLNSVRALLSIEIDGVDVLDGEKLVISANGEVDLQRFIKNGNKEQGNRFKFIERTSKIEEHRGVGAVDGLIRVSFQYEKRKTVEVKDLVKIVEHHHHYPTWRPYYTFYDYPHRRTLLGDIMCSTASATATASIATNGLNQQYAAKASDGRNTLRSLNKSYDGDSMRGLISNTANAVGLGEAQTFMDQSTFADMERAYAAPDVNDVGITVPGSISDQKFHEAEAFDVEQEVTVITLNLKGQTEKAKVKAPVTVKTKLKCETCGTVNKSNAKFCRECGTGLERA